MENFGVDFQRNVMKCVYRSPKFMAQYSDAILPDIFTDWVSKTLILIAKDFFSKYKCLPDKESTNLILGNIPQATPELKQVADSVFSAPVPQEIFEEEYIRFARHRRVEQALFEANKLHQGRQYEQMVDAFKQAVSFGEPMDLGTDYFEFAETRLLSPPENLKAIATLIDPTFDQQLGGGFKPGELIILMAGPKVGKTTAMVEFSAAAVLQGYTVVFCSFEVQDNAQADYPLSTRFDAKFTGLTKAETKEARNTTLDYVRGMGATVKGKLIIKEFRQKLHTAIDIEKYLLLLRNKKGITPDMLVVDYPRVMGYYPGVTELRHHISETVLHLRGLGGELKMPVLVPAQSKSSTWGDMSNFKLDDLGEDKSQVAHCDKLIAMCQSVEEKRPTPEVSFCRLVALAQRDDASNVEVPCSIDYARSTIQAGI